jgi:hypothetical protein
VRPASGNGGHAAQLGDQLDVKSLEMAFVLIDERRTDSSDRITGNPYIATIEVALE